MLLASNHWQPFLTRFIQSHMSIKRFIVSISPPVVIHTISANSCVIASATRFILFLPISPDGSMHPLSKSPFFMLSSCSCA